MNDSADNMAPALTEPLSPAEKLNNSTATATPTTRSSSNNKKLDADVATNISSANTNATTSAAPTVGTTNKEKRTRNTPTPTTSTRITRSKDKDTKDKDAYQRIFEQAVTITPPATETVSETNSKSNKNNADTNIHNNNNETAAPDSNAHGQSNCKDTSNAQLLADLTNDFDEAISAEICPRKKLSNAGIEKVSNSATGGDAESDAIATLAAGVDSLVAADPTVETAVENTIIVAQSTQPTTVAANVPVSDEKKQVADVQQPKLADLRAQILSLEELPPISTDSTMTASEVEDNLEERLSQLDGTAVTLTSSKTDETKPSLPPTDALHATATEAPVTPPRTPPRTQEQQQMHCLQQQLQHTPTTPVSQQVQQQQHTPHNNTCTPQSTGGSSVNTLGSGNLPQAFMKESTTGDLEDTDIEEVLKALKNFDPNTGADTLCDLNVLFSEVYTTLNYEEISSQPASTSSKPNPLKECRAEIDKKQQTMQRKIDFLIRRLRKVQSRYMCRHASEEIAGLFEWSARMASKGVRANSSSTHLTTLETDATTMSAAMSVIAGRPPAQTWVGEKKNPIPSTQISALLRKLETVANAQQLRTSTGHHSSGYTTNTQQPRKSKKLGYDASTASSSSAVALAAVNEQKGEVVVPTYDANVAEELTHIAGLLQTEMREVQTAIDSDATESSSGGESADEMVTYNNQIQQSLSIAKRAAWRYSRDRAAIASRWSWLHLQIADLEIKIRQHSELHQEIVRTKGAVKCDAELATAAEEAKSGDALNGYKGSSNMNSNLSNSNLTKDDNDADALPGASRTRGYVASKFRKRKLLQTPNIHTISKKAARPSNIKCGCQWPLQPCALCTGRSDPTAPRDLPDTMMMPDRIALLDACFHPVLSFPEDISTSIHFEAIARLPEWQQRVMRCQVKSIAKSVWKAEREAAAAAGHHHISKKYGGDPTTKRRYIKKKDRLAEAAAAAATTTANATTSAAATAVSGLPKASTTGTTIDAENGTGSMSTTSTTPLVANKLPKNTKKVHCHPVGDGVLLEPLHATLTNNSTNAGSNSIPNNNYIHQTSDYPLTNYDQYNHNQIHSSSISSKHSNKRKLSSTTTANTAATNAYHHHQQHNNSFYNHYNNSNSNNAFGNNNETNFLHTNDNWDAPPIRSRNSSPTHGGVGGSNYKYERSLDRRNRSSYDIDNIVIPYSVAAATRVEILPYKEIPTPKWRVIEDGKAARSQKTNGDEKQIGGEKAPTCNGVQNAAEAVKTSATAEETASNATTDSKVAADIAPLKADKAKDINAVDTVETKKLEVPAENMKINNVEKQTVAEETSLNAKPKLQIEQVKVAKQTAENALHVPQQSVEEELEASWPKKLKIDADMATAVASKDIKTAETTYVQGKPKLATAPTTTAATNAVDVNTVEAELDEAEDGEEDISDEAMILRHERALTEERRKFQTFLKFPWSTRSRANRRIDSRAESSGANTPDPASPAPNTPSVGGGDQESIPSPLAPSTPLDSIPEVTSSDNAHVLHYINNKRCERRRTTSTKRNGDADRRSSTPDPKEFMPPYEPLKFPLPDEVFANLMQVMPNEYQEYDDNSASNKVGTRNRTNLKSFSSVSDVAVSTHAKRKAKSNNCDVSSRGNSRHKTKSHRIGVDGPPITGDMLYANGGKEHNAAGNGADNEDPLGDVDYAVEDDDVDDDDDDEDEEDDTIDDYPKHHLAAPNDDVFDGNIAAAYQRAERRLLLDDSDASSETEPFQDDDPNDPEWKGESEERRAERIRKKL